MLFLTLFGLGLLGLRYVVGYQQPLHIPTGEGNLTAADHTHSSNSFTPLENLSTLKFSTFTSLTHPAFPKHSVRIKKSNFCDGNVSAYTGYIDIEAKHLFFYFFESRNDPDKDDVIFWTNGGPGGSSALGLFMELGPCWVNENNGTIYNPYSWNENANIFFVDQPVGVGYSYADYGESVSTSVEAGKDIAAFVAIFFEHFSKFKGRGFHMAGESYGGRYVPVFASEVYDQNTKLIEQGMTPINLNSIMLGNGCTDFATMMLSYYDMQCHPMSVPPVLDISSCVRMKQKVPRCDKMLKKSCIDKFDAIDCGAAYSFCYDSFEGVFEASGYNRFDMTKRCEGELRESACYPIVRDIERYLNKPDIREAIGIDPNFTANYTFASLPVSVAFGNTMDIAFPTQYYVTALLERGIRTLLYIGTNDFACNWVGNERMSLALEWTKSAEFSNQPLREWKIGDQVVGRVRSSGPLTYATIHDAGHMVPYDKPDVSLELVKRWLAGKEL